MSVIEYSILFIMAFAAMLSFLKIKNTKGAFVFISIFILFLIAALRGEKVGNDTLRYVRQYAIYSKYTFKQMMQFYGDSKIKDPTYYFTGWFFSRFFENPQWWLGFIAALFCGAVGKLIYKESSMPVMSIVALMSLGFYRFSLTGMRQTIAIALVVMSYKYIKEKKLIFFVILVLIASMYHKSAMVFLIAYPVSKFKIGKYHVIAAATLMVIFFLYQNKLLDVMSDFFTEERYQGYMSGESATLTISGFIIQAAIFTYEMFYYKGALKEDKNNIILYNLAFIGMVAQLYSSFLAVMFRISMYFSIFNIVLIPNVSMLEKKKAIRITFQLLLFSIFLLYMLKDGAAYYEFFWEK